MKLKGTLVLAGLLAINFSAIAQFHPGGVPGSEVWFIANESDIIAGNYTNNAVDTISIEACNEMQALPDLYNFNPSIFSENLCLQYQGTMENTNGRDLFFVGEHYQSLDVNQSHFATEWVDEIGNIITIDQSTVPHSYYNLNTLNGWTKDVSNSYSNEFTSHLYSYHTNTYFIDKKYKSYGSKGETLFKIGDVSAIPVGAQLNDKQFVGELPEYISYNRELSVNERTRVESYLALKYGLTLNSSISYLSAANKVFWDAANNELFGNRIFGIGKDDVSTLNQLQSESSHLQGFLVSAVGAIVTSNPEKQLTASLSDQNFLVYGDNGAENIDFEKILDNGTKTFSRVWLAQSTGINMPQNDIHFELALTPSQIDFLASNPEYNIWLLRDPFEDNTTVSDFNSPHVEYYLGVLDIAEKKAIFSGIYFDQDESKYDQFTFGINDQLIVQATYRGCAGEELFIDVDVYGCKEGMTIQIEGSNGYNDEFNVEELPFTFNGEEGTEYTINVFCNTGSTGTTNITIEVPSISVDLGLDQELTTSQNFILLDAGINVQDPEATYVWYQDGVRINHAEATFEATEPGSYNVEVTSGNRACTVSDTIIITTQQLQVQTTIAKCDGLNTDYNVTALSGVGPYRMELQRTDLNNNTTTSTFYTFNQATVVNIYQYGYYTITIEDRSGHIFVDSFIIDAPVNITILQQLQALEATTSGNLFMNFNGYAGVYPIFQSDVYELNAQIYDSQQGLPLTNLRYEWYINGNFYTDNPIISFAINGEGGIPCEFYNGKENLISLRVVNTITGCFQGFDYYHQSDGSPTEDCNKEPLKAIIVGNQTQVAEERNVKTIVHPNPSKVDVEFNYDITSIEILNGTVEVFSPNSQLLQTIAVEGSNSYSLPFSLYTSGVYLIRLTTITGTIIVDRVIIR